MYGFTVVEMIVVIGIVSAIAIGVGTYGYEGMRRWNITRSQVDAQEDARSAMHDVTGDVREMILSDNGSYPLEIAEPFEIVFYANVQGDARREKIRYALEGTTLYRWVVNADTAEPPQYPAFTEDDGHIAAENIMNEDYIFRYYDKTYDGSSAPLAEPVSLREVSLVQIKFLVETGYGQQSQQLEIGTNISLRNLKYTYEE